MKIKTNKILVAFALILTFALALVPMFAITTSAEEASATLSFADKANRTEYSTSKQVWKQNGIKLTNDKSASTSNVGDYANPVRLYANSKVTIEAPGNITKIVANCKETKHVTPLVNSAGSEIASSNGKTVTILPSASSTSFVMEKLTAQIQLTDITVTYTVSCTHSNTTETVVNATKTEDGSKTVTCVDCGYEVSKEVITALGCKVTFVVPNGAEAPTVEDTVKVTMPAGVMPEGNFAREYTFAGWANASVSNTTECPTLYNEGDEVTLTDDTTFYAVYTYSEKSEGGSGTASYQLSNTINAGDTVVITVTTKTGVVYALTDANGSSKAPSAIEINVANGTIIDAVDSAINWVVGGNASGYIFYTDDTETKWLYCTSDNNGVRVGTNAAKTFVVDSTSGYLKHTGTGRYVGVYLTNPDWRCYTNTTGNTANQTLGFYVLKASDTVTYYTSTLETTECNHEDATITTTPASCTENGSIVTTCKCGYSDTKVIEAKGHNYECEQTKKPGCEEAGENTYTCTVCDDSYTEPVEATGHNYVGGVCENCGAEKPSTPDYSGRYYIATIRSSGNYWYMTNDLGTASTKRYQAVDSGLTELPASITNPDSNYVFVLVKNDDDTYCIYSEGIDGDNYLGWTSGKSGTFVSADKAIKFTVDKKDDGTFNIYFSTRYLSLNGTNGNNYFAMYEGTQKQDLSLIPVGEGSGEGEGEDTCTHSIKFTQASVRLGADLTMIYYVEACEHINVESYTVKFVFNGKETKANATKYDDGSYGFELTGIVPQAMADNIAAYLIDATNTTVETKDNYSVKAYAKTILDGEYSAAAKALVSDMLAYGAAAQKYTGHTGESATEGVANLTGTNANPTESDLNRKIVTSGDKIDGIGFTSAGVKFDYVNYIYAKFTAKAGTDFEIKINGKVVNAEALEDGSYIVYTDAISATQFDDEYTVTLTVNGTLYQTLTYTVNSYAYAKADSDTMGELAIALYRYGKSAEAYNAAK